MMLLSSHTARFHRSASAESTAETAVRSERRRRGFTIIELLIVVGILLLLTTFTIVSIDFAFEAERVASGARQVQSLLTGARDRAIRYRKPIGVRFLVDQDPDNGRMVSSMVYVGASDYWSLGNITLKRPDLNPQDGVADSDSVLIVDGDAETRWNKLRLRGFLGIYEDTNANGALDPGEDVNGNGVLDLETPRIKIPGDRNGTWYRVRTHLLGKSAKPDEKNRLVLVNEFRDPGTTPPSEIIAFEGTGHSTYLLELPPRVLPDAEPVTLPDGVVIDLDASEIPSSWRPGAGGFPIPCSNRMDLMFSPRGTVTGTPAGLGMLHFYIALRSDVQVKMDAINASSNPALKPVDGSATPIVPSDAILTSISAQNPPPIGDRALVSISTATGKVASFPINPTDSDLDGRLDDPYAYAELGEALSK
ncbi:prepilin-type N-terminal cleavage/methylation domain-containing protein [bacterium]|nr:prepilin-type N-terminal cleavage/methylation domain-containing protein [bacterium]